MKSRNIFAVRFYKNAINFFRKALNIFAVAQTKAGVLQKMWASTTKNAIVPMFNGNCLFCKRFKNFAYILAP
jgi:hypothetical protein